jgi:hypothetical protein
MEQISTEQRVDRKSSSAEWHCSSSRVELSGRIAPLCTPQAPGWALASSRTLTWSPTWPLQVAPLPKGRNISGVGRTGPEVTTMLRAARSSQKIHVAETSSGRRDYGKYRVRSVYAMGPPPAIVP